MAQKRFTYWTADGKRHWTPFIGIAVELSEFEKHGPADRRYDFRMWDKQFRADASRGASGRAAPARSRRKSRGPSRKRK
jgi:hypothetical protein